jgi:murein DD-endopeptidase MepM/ murein hydrolase activator NlpD
MPRSAVARLCRSTAYWGAGRRGRATALAVFAAGAIGWAAAPAQAMPADTGGTSPVAIPAPAPAAKPVPGSPPATANLYGRPAPRVKRVRCAESCDGPAIARAGALVRVAGRGLGRVEEVIFLGAAGEDDDASAAPRSVSRRALVARVPRTAPSGPVAVALGDGTRSPATRTSLVVGVVPVAIPAGVIDAEAQDRKVFFGGGRPAELSYVVGGTEPAEVAVELVRAADGDVVASWKPGLVEPGVPQTVRWDGTTAGRVQHDGVYRFRVTATGASGARATSSAESAEDAPEEFTFLRHRFPIAGAHEYGEGAAAFGGGRGHQGQDVFAACGTPIVAARGGVVKFKQYHSRAGYYVVIDGARTGVDYSYMHLREAALVDAGERVETGQLIGFVGDSGRADGCHLHFEEWSAPGWYDGGSAFDPLPDLRAWDARS